MSNEITVSAQLKNVNGDLTRERRVTSKQFNQSNQGLSSEVQTIGTSSESINISSDISTAGYAFFRNLDSTNFVEIGVEDGNSTFIAFAKLKPGEFGVIRLATSSIFAKADTASIKLEHMILDD